MMSVVLKSEPENQQTKDRHGEPPSPYHEGVTSAALFCRSGHALRAKHAAPVLGYALPTEVAPAARTASRRLPLRVVQKTKFDGSGHGAPAGSGGIGTANAVTRRLRIRSNSRAAMIPVARFTPDVATTPAIPVGELCQLI